MRRASWTEENLQSALNSVASGSSQHTASKLFKIPRRTLRNHLKTGRKTKKLGRYAILSEQQDDELTSRILRYSEIGMPITIPIIKSYVYEFCDQNDIKNPFNSSKKAAGRYWVANYLKRHQEISKRKAQMMNPGRAMKLNKHIVRDYFDKLKSVMEQNDLYGKPRRIFNMDEKGCRLTLHHQQQVLAGKGAKRVHMVAPEHAENVTIVACADASGGTIPPMIIFKGKRNNPEFQDNLPPDTLVCVSEKGSITTQLFIAWLEHFAKFKPPGKVLLIFDGASSHINPSIVAVADKHEILCLCLPSNTTHELQPLDKAVFKSFEHFWDCEVLKYWRAHPERVITKGRFGSIFTPAYNSALSIKNITSGFSSTGIYPFYPQAIPEEAYGPSALSFQEDLEVCVDDGLCNSNVYTENIDIPVQDIASSSLTVRWPLTNDVACSSTMLLTEPQQLNEVSGEFEDLIELSTTQEDSPGSDTLNVSFSELMKTPKLTRKRTVRKKSLTYKAQVVTKELFRTQDSCTKENAHPTNTLHKKKIKPKRPVQKPKKKAAASWYCAVCKEDTHLSMRQCCRCHVWYHEDCVGLESDDEDDFICMECE